MNRIKLEICLGSVDDAVAAFKGGADRIELCANRPMGGTTPSAGLIAGVRDAVPIPIHVLIRPRAGDFCYTAAEMEVMRRDIAVAKDLGADGVVFGILLPENRIDRKRTAGLVRIARPMSVTFHRAFDSAPDPVEALNELADLGVDRLLTAGGKSSAPAGAVRIRSLILRAGRRVTILPGGGINAGNLRPFLRSTRAGEVHIGSGVEGEPDRAKGPFTRSFGQNRVVEKARVAAIVRILGTI